MGKSDLMDKSIGFRAIKSRFFLHQRLDYTNLICFVYKIDNLIHKSIIHPWLFFSVASPDFSELERSKTSAWSNAFGAGLLTRFL